MSEENKPVEGKEEVSNVIPIIGDKNQVTYPITEKQSEELDKTFLFVDLDEDQKSRQKDIYEGARVFARVICSNVKMGQMQMSAIQNLYRAVMDSVQSIQFEK